MKALKLVLTGIAMLMAILLVATKIFTGTPKKLQPVKTTRFRDSMVQEKKEALMAFPLYTPVSMPY